MDMLERFAGIDWGSRTHQVCVVDNKGEVLAERAFDHGGAGLAEMAAWILAAADAEPRAVGIAIEVPHGPVVETLMERGFPVHAVNPKQLDRFRDRFSPAGAKDDRRDARVLANALRTDGQAFRHLDPEAPEIVELREWSRIASRLTRDRTRCVNQARQQFWRYYPKFCEVGSDLSKAWVRELRRLAPTPAKARRVRASTVAAIPNGTGCAGSTPKPCSGSCASRRSPSRRAPPRPWSPMSESSSRSSPSSNSSSRRRTGNSTA